MSRRGRSVSLGRHRDRGPRDSSRPPEEEVSTRHNISNFLLTLQRVQASEEENRQLRKENQLLRQRTRSSRLSSASFRGHNCYTDGQEQTTTTVVPDAEDEVIAADVKRNSLLFVGDTSSPPSPEHIALEAQYKKLQEDFETVKEFLKHLFQHALTMSTSDGRVPGDVKEGVKDKVHHDVNTWNPAPSKQLEHSLDDIHGQISQLRSSQDQQQVKMEQVQKALDNVLCHSSVRNDVTMRIVRQQDKMKEITRHTNFLEDQLTTAVVSLRQTEEKLRQTSGVGCKLEDFIVGNSKHLKGNTKDELYKFADQLKRLGSRNNQSCSCKMAAVSKLVSHVTAAANQGQSLTDSRPPADVVDAMSKLERLIGSDWHRLGRMLGLTSDTLDDIGKFTNFDLTSRVEKVVTAWVKQTRGANAEGLHQGLDKMDRDILLVTEQPLCKEWFQLPPEVSTFAVAHIIDVSSLVTHMAGQGMLSQDSSTFILSSIQEHRRASRLLQCAVYMGPGALCELCAALNVHNQSLVAEKIKGCLPSQYLRTPSQQQQQQKSSVTLDRNNRTSHPRNTSTDRTSTFTYSHQRPPSLSSSSSSSNTKESTTTTTTIPSSSSKPPSKAASSTPVTTTKSGEKPRKKRSRSLFTRKNKLRDSELDVELATDVGQQHHQHEDYNYNYNYPAINLKAAGQNGGSGGREEGGTQARRQYGRQAFHGRVTNTSGECIV